MEAINVASEPHLKEDAISFTDGLVIALASTVPAYSLAAVIGSIVVLIGLQMQAALSVGLSGEGTRLNRSSSAAVRPPIRRRWNKPTCTLRNNCRTVLSLASANRLREIGRPVQL